MVSLALAALLGLAGLALDVAVSVLGCQQCQMIADAGALAGVQQWRDPSQAQVVANETSNANIPVSSSADFTVTVNYFAEGETVPTTGDPAPTGGALTVTASKWVRYNFLPVIGQEGTTVRRSATATRYLTGICIAPIWIWHTTPVTYGQSINLLMADSPHTGIPGSFGFLTPAGGVDFQLALKGLINLEQEELQRVEAGDTVWAKTGLAVDQFRGPLETDWNSRINRGWWNPWGGDTFWRFRADNPRILIVPFVEYLSGTGSGASFRVHRFGAFWLEDVITNGSNRYIQGRFIDFMKPGGKILGVNPGSLVG